MNHQELPFVVKCDIPLSHPTLEDPTSRQIKNYYEVFSVMDGTGTAIDRPADVAYIPVSELQKIFSTFGWDRVLPPGEQPYEANHRSSFNNLSDYLLGRYGGGLSEDGVEFIRRAYDGCLIEVGSHMSKAIANHSVGCHANAASEILETFRVIERGFKGRDSILELTMVLFYGWNGMENPLRSGDLVRLPEMMNTSGLRAHNSSGLSYVTLNPINSRWSIVQ